MKPTLQNFWNLFAAQAIFVGVGLLLSSLLAFGIEKFLDWGWVLSLSAFIIFCVYIIKDCEKVFNGYTHDIEELIKASNSIRQVMSECVSLLRSQTEVIKGFAAHELEIFKAITDARARLSIPITIEGAAGDVNISAMLFSSLREHSPNIKSDKHFSVLLTSIEQLHLKMTTSVSSYNDLVGDYICSISSLMGRIYAYFLGLSELKYLEFSHHPSTT